MQIIKKTERAMREKDFQRHLQPKTGRHESWRAGLGSDQCSACRVGDAVLGLVCMVLLLVLKLMRDHVPPVHPEMPPGVRLSHGLVWTATTGERPTPQRLRTDWATRHGHLGNPASP
jgi:hypothetical protein